MINFTKHKNFNISYRLSEDNLRKLENILNEMTEQNSSNVITYNVTLKNGEHNDGLNLQDLLNLPNIKKSSIVRFTARASLGLDHNSLFLTFRDSWMNSVSYILETTNKKDLLYYEAKINEYIDSLKTMYSFFYQGGIIAFTLIVMPIVLLILNTIKKILISFSVSPILGEYFGLYLFGSVAITFLFIILISAIFPVNEILIGHGIEKASKRKWFRNSIILAILLSIIPIIIEFFINK